MLSVLAICTMETFLILFVVFTVNYCGIKFQEVLRTVSFFMAVKLEEKNQTSHSKQKQVIFISVLSYTMLLKWFPNLFI